MYTDSIDTLALNVGGANYGSTFANFDSLLQLFGLPYHLLGEPWREQINNNGRYKAYALYGDVIWHLSDKFNLTTGVRFTRDQKRFSWFNPPRLAPGLDRTIDALDAMGLLALAGVTPDDFRQNLIFNPASGAPVGVLVQSRNTWNDLSPRVVVDYTFTPDVMVYGSVTKGYKAGGYNSVQIGSHFAHRRRCSMSRPASRPCSPAPTCCSTPAPTTTATTTVSRSPSIRTAPAPACHATWWPAPTRRPTASRWNCNGSRTRRSGWA
ncbi:hypothetical protein RLIN73S_02681 [Rhodanobacter lindaniclasticus]